MVRKALKRMFIVLVVLAVAGTAIVSAVAQRPVAEFGSVQEVADDITGFYSVALDRQDITEGEFTLGVVPGKKIVVTATAPTLDEFVVEGVRTVSYSDDGMKLSVSTSPDTHGVDVSFGSVFPGVTSVLRILWNGEEIEVPVRLNFAVWNNQLNAEDGATQALLALDPDAPHEYVVRVVETDEIQMLTDEVMTWFPGDPILDALTPYGEEDLFWGVEDYDAWLPYIAMRGLTDGLRDYVFEGYVRKEVDVLVDQRYYELLDANERLPELDAEIQQIYDELDLVIDSPTEEDLESRDALDTRLESLSQEYRALDEQLRDEAQETTELPEWLSRALNDGELTREGVLALAEQLMFAVELEVLSVDGIDVSG